jgi:hypothetical protein
LRNLDASKRKLAVLEEAPVQTGIELQGRRGSFPGITVSGLGLEDKALARELVERIFATYPPDDVAYRPGVSAGQWRKGGGGLVSADLMNWQHQTVLHFASTEDDVERAAMLLDAGASISARDEEYRSTPLAWAAHTNAVQMVELLLARGAATHVPDDEPWATPLPGPSGVNMPPLCRRSTGTELTDSGNP